MSKRIGSNLLPWLFLKTPVLLYALISLSCSNTPTINLERLKSCVKTNKRCLIVLSVATKNVPADSYRWYTEGLKKLDYDFHIIGTQLDWKGWITRGEAMKEALLTLEEHFSQKEMKEKIIIVTSDTGDVLVQQSPKQLLNKFEKKLIDIKTKFDQKLDADDLVIVGGEWWCGGNCESTHKWFDRLNIDKNDRLFPYAQGGFLMGPASAAKRFYSYTVNFMRSKINDDQIAMGNFALEHGAHIYIDYQQEIAATMLEYAPGDETPVTGFDYLEDHLYVFADRGIALSKELQQRIGSADQIYPAFLHVPNNTRRQSVKDFWEKLVAHVKAKAWQ